MTRTEHPVFATSDNYALITVTTEEKGERQTWTFPRAEVTVSNEHLYDEIVDDWAEVNSLKWFKDGVSIELQARILPGEDGRYGEVTNERIEVPRTEVKHETSVKIKDDYTVQDIMDAAEHAGAPLSAVPHLYVDRYGDNQQWVRFTWRT